MLVDDLMITASVEQILDTLKEGLQEININRFDVIRRNGDNVQTNCPFHKDGQEKKPSFGIRESDGMCHCFTCGWANPISVMISSLFGKEDGGLYGKQWLRRKFTTTEINIRNVPTYNSLRKQVSRGEEPKYVSEEELNSYRYSTPEFQREGLRFVHPYWAKRGITDAHIIELFDLGYDEETSCITFPIRDKDGHCLFVARRSVCTKYFNYPSGVEKPLYGLYEYFTDVQRQINELRCRRYGKSYFLERANELIICESMLDALSFWQIGKYALALNGTGSKEQIEELKKLPCRKYILCTDMDEAGMNARVKLRAELTNKIIREYYLPKGKKDANECTQEELKNLKEIL